MINHIKTLKSVLAALPPGIPKRERGVIPDFDWLWDGDNMRVWAEENSIYGDRVMDIFIEQNSDILSQFDVIEFIGSGAIGDAWLLEGDKVLKIFDGAAINDKTELDMSEYEVYQDKISRLHKGVADIGDPMVYELGLFRTRGLENTSFEGDFSSGGYFEPAYVILEKVGSFEQTTDDVLHGQEKNFRFPFTEQEVFRAGTDITFNEYEDALHHPARKIALVEKVINETFNAIIDMAVEVFDANDPAFASPYAKYDLTKDSEIKRASDDLARRVKSGNMKALGNVPNKVVDLFKMDPNWVNDLIRSSIMQCIQGRKDLHVGNFGFRNNRIVFYDS